MMAEKFTLEGFATFLLDTIAEEGRLQHEALEKGAEIIADEAKRVLGTHDYGWPPLQPETIARKAAGDTPLLETGEMRDSIQWNADANEAYIGSDLPRAVAHELGTAHVPPRPFLSGAAAHKAGEVAEVMGRHVVMNLFKGHVDE